MELFVAIVVFALCPRCYGRLTGRMRPSLEGSNQRTPKTARSAKVSPETTPPAKRSNENAVSAVSSPKRSRPDTLEQWRGSAYDGGEGVKGEETGKFASFAHVCSCGMEVPHSFGKGSTQQYMKLNSQAEYAGVGDEELLGLEASCASCCQLIWNILFQSVQPFRWLSKKRRNRSPKTKRSANWDFLPVDIRESILRRLSLKDLFRFKALSKSCEALTKSDAFLRFRGESGEGSYTAINFFTKDKAWQCRGFELKSKKWTRLPSFSCLPPPDVSLFKEYSVCGHGGLMCANVSKVPHKEELVVFNLLTGVTRKLPSLHYPRNPVLLHILVDSATSTYKVIAAGSSSSSGEKDLSRRVEVFDSRTMQWKVASDLPGPEFGLNEHQTGVCVDGVLYFIAFLEGDGRKGVVAFDVEKGEWLQDRNRSVPHSLSANILQVVESGGKVYLFSEQESDGAVEHCIDELDISGARGEAGCAELKSVVRVKKSGGRGLLVYPEYTCVPYGIGKLCIFNTIKRDGLVYDILSGLQCEVLEEPPPNQGGDNFFSLNPVSFTLQPNFTSKP